jgi:MFS superfamily sulfate permease-like transporter
MKSLSNLRQDLPAGIVVFFVAVPLCLGIALASGAPPFSGLVAGIVGGIVVGILSGSPLGVSGPAAGLAVIVLRAIEQLGFEPFLAAVVLAGLLQVGMGLARAGVLAYFFPSSVIKGMLSGIGVLIILKQIPHALGHDTDAEGDMSYEQVDGDTTLGALGHMFEDFTPAAMLVSGVALAILILWDRVLTKRGGLFKMLQGPLVAVVFGIAYQALTSRFAPDWALSLEHLVQVQVIGSLSEVGSLLVHPDWSAFGSHAVWVTAITIAVVASLETLLCVDATDRMDPEKRKTPTNRELLAQGVGNMTSGLLGGLPVTQVIVRSSANIQSGGKSKTSAILHGFLILLFVLVLPQVLNLVPLAALAAVLLVVGYKLAKPALIKEQWAAGWSQFIPFTVTVLGIVFTDLLTGIGLGLGVALFVLLRAHFLNSHLLHQTEEGEYQLTLAEEVSFLNKGALAGELERLPSGSRIVVDLRKVVHMDHDVKEVLDEFTAGAAARSITIERHDPVPGPQPVTAQAS